MANIDAAFPSKYLKASDLMGRRVTVIMTEVRTEEVGRDKELRPVLFFKGKDKGIVLNKTNAKKISEAYGPETDVWFGQPIILFEAQVDFGGDTVPAIRVAIPPSDASDRVPGPRVMPPARQAVHFQKPIDDLPVQTGSDHRDPGSHAVDLDDDIPFAPEMRG